MNCEERIYSKVRHLTIFLEIFGKSKKILSHNSRYSGRESNQVPLQYISELLLFNYSEFWFISRQIQQWILYVIKLMDAQWIMDWHDRPSLSIIPNAVLNTKTHKTDGQFTYFPRGGLKLGPPNYQAEMHRNLAFGTKKKSQCLIIYSERVALLKTTSSL